MPVPWAYGTPSFPSRSIPGTLSEEDYPGIRDYKAGLRGFSRLAYGPEAGALADIGVAQASDPMAQAYSGGLQAGGGAYSTPGGATGLYAGLLGSMMRNPALRQQIQSQ